MADHGYGPYSHGCRCDICRAANAAYSRARRAAAYLNTSTDPVPGITHGRSGYEEHGCRCPVCVEARRAMWRADSQRRRKAGAA